MQRTLWPKEWCLFITPILIFVGIGLTQLWPKREVEVSIRPQSSLQAGCRASLPALSKLLSQFPRSTIYTVRWQVGSKTFLMQYNSLEKELWYGPPHQVFNNNTVSWSFWWHQVTKKGIHNVARKNGTLEGLRAYGSDCV